MATIGNFCIITIATTWNYVHRTAGLWVRTNIMYILYPEEVHVGHCLRQTCTKVWWIIKSAKVLPA